MTVFLPLAVDTPLPSTPSFLLESTDSRTQISKVIKSIMKAKRMVVICGAGISVQAGIPDFRSSDGLFKTLKRDNPREVLASGRDLFDASVFNSEHTTTLFCQMIAQLWGLSQAAEPTAFHNTLRALDKRGKLLRVYTQNIDAIEEKCGLSFGVPYLDKRHKSRTKTPISVTEPVCPAEADANKSTAEPPRCIPLHGTLRTLHCQICNYSYPVEHHLPSLSAGLPPQCPECISMEETRQLIGKRARGIGRLRPSVVLYNEAHNDGEGVGEVVQKDLLGSSKGKGADLLLVVGTSLRVPGTKRMVREFSKAVRSRSSQATTDISGTHLRSSANDEEPSVKTIYLNIDFPVPTREWDGVFDAWIQGDAQEFAQMLQEEIDKETITRERAAERKRKREEVLSLHHTDREGIPETPSKIFQVHKQMIRKAFSSPLHSPKRRKIELPPTPPKTPSPISNSPKLFLRIPPRPKRVFVVPEVYITAQPPLARNSGSGQILITPEKSPPAGRRAYAVPKARALASRKRGVAFSNSSLSSPSDDDNDTSDVHLLPDSFIRTIQYGLRGSGG